MQLLILLGCTSTHLWGNLTPYSGGFNVLFFISCEPNMCCKYTLIIIIIMIIKLSLKLLFGICALKGPWSHVEESEYLNSKVYFKEFDKCGGIFPKKDHVC